MFDGFMSDGILAVEEGEAETPALSEKTSGQSAIPSDAID